MLFRSFYTLVYVLVTLGAFGVILLGAREGHEADELDDYRGLSRRDSLLALLLAGLMFATAGIPPFVGFYAKLAILQALITTNLTGNLILALVAVLFSLVGAFYYLRLIKVMFFDSSNQAALPARSSGIGSVLALNGAAILFFGIMPDGLMSLCREAVIKALSS